jgi:phage terminase large subunit-like protein
MGLFLPAAKSIPKRLEKSGGVARVEKERSKVTRIKNGIITPSLLNGVIMHPLEVRGQKKRHPKVPLF